MEPEDKDTRRQSVLSTRRSADPLALNALTHLLSQCTRVELRFRSVFVLWHLQPHTGGMGDRRGLSLQLGKT